MLVVEARDLVLRLLDVDPAVLDRGLLVPATMSVELPGCMNCIGAAACAVGIS